MAEKLTEFRVFVASPRDVSEERYRLKEVIDELNRGIAENKGLRLQYVSWKTHVRPGMGKDAQDVINKEIGPYDIFIGIIWKRFGTPTKRAGSGTEEEFERTYSLWAEYGRPHIMLYFNTTPFFPSSEDDVKQMGKVLKFKEKVEEKGALYWEYNGPDEFEKYVRDHLTKEILKWGDNLRSVSPPTIVRLPFEFFQVLFNELDIYITQFDQLQRDYNRELKGDRLVFAVDFSEIHNYMYPYPTESPRSNLNQYVFKTIENPLTLMPGAVGELLTDLERALPNPDVLERDPLMIYKKVAQYINNFPKVINNEDKIIKLYSQAEDQLKKAWGELFYSVMQGAHHSPFNAVKELIDQEKLSPIKGIQRITGFPLDVREKARWVRSRLDLERPGRGRNNQVDTIDFAVTWLLNTQKHDRKRRYFSIYTQSQFFINACTATYQLRWENDYLVRGANYFKIRTMLQELFRSLKQRHDFVVKWSKKCRQLQNEIPSLIEIGNDPSRLKKPSLKLLNLYREFDEECRMPLAFSGEFGEKEKSDVRKRATDLYSMLKKKGEFRARTGEAFEVLKRHLQDLQENITLFAPEEVRTKESKIYIENLNKWIESEKLEEGKTERREKGK